MNNERQQALGSYMMLKKQIYELGILAQSHVEAIHEEINSFTSEKDFSTMDFKKVETLSKELQKLQEEFKEKAAKMDSLKSTYNF